MITSIVRHKPLTTFVVFSFLSAWIIWYFAGAYESVTILYKPLGYRWLMAQIGVYAPALISTILLPFYRKQSKYSIRTRAIWLMFFLVLACSLLLSTYDYEKIFKSHVPAITVIGVSLTVILLFGSTNESWIHLFSPHNRGRRYFAWWSLSIGLFPILMIIASGKHLRLSPILSLEGNWSEGLLTILTLFSYNLILGGSLGEEPGWRGFALPLLQERYGSLKASLLLGIIWAVWHAPLDIAHGFLSLQGIGAVLARILWTLPLSVLFTFFYNRTDGSVLTAILLHTSLNFSFDLFTVDATNFSIFMILILIAMGICIYLELKRKFHQETTLDNRCEYHQQDQATEI